MIEQLINLIKNLHSLEAETVSESSVTFSQFLYSEAILS